MSGEPNGPGSLKYVTAFSTNRSLTDEVRVALERNVQPADVRHVRRDAFLVYTEADTSSIRDWLAPLLQGGESVFVVEFERWSGYGPAIDREWLRRRGH